MLQLLSLKPRACAAREATATRRLSVATREYPQLTTSRESLHAAMKTQYRQKKKKELLFIAHLQRARPGPNVSHDLL